MQLITEKIIFLLINLLNWCHGQNTNNNEELPYSVQTFDELPKLHLKSIEDTKLYYSTWSLLVHSELSTWEYIEENIHAEIRILGDGGSFALRLISYFLEVLLDKCQKKRKKIFSSIEYENDYKGETSENVNKKIFGSMNNETAAYYNDAIKEFKNDLRDITVNFKNKEKLMNIRLNPINEMLSDYLIGIQNRLNYFVHLNFHYSLEDEKELMSNFFNLKTIIIEYLNFMDKIEQSIENSKKGVILPELIEPKLLQQILFKMSLYEPKMEKGNYVKYFNISEISFAVIDNKIIFRIEMPVVECYKYHLYNLETIPSKSNNDLPSVNIDIPYKSVLINYFHNFFSPVNSNYLSNCKKLNKTLICKGLNLRSLSYTYGSCLNALLSLGYVDASMCTPNMLNIRALTVIPLSNNQSWLITSPLEQRVVITCNDQNYFITIQDTCAIHLQNECSLRYKRVTLHTSSNIGQIDTNSSNILSYKMPIFEVDNEPFKHSALYKIHIINQIIKNSNYDYYYGNNILDNSSYDNDMDEVSVYKNNFKRFMIDVIASGVLCLSYAILIISGIYICVLMCFHICKLLASFFTIQKNDSSEKQYQSLNLPKYIKSLDNIETIKTEI